MNYCCSLVVLVRDAIVCSDNACSRVGLFWLSATIDAAKASICAMLAASNYNGKNLPWRYGQKPRIPVNAIVQYHVNAAARSSQRRPSPPLVRDPSDGVWKAAFTTSDDDDENHTVDLPRAVAESVIKCQPAGILRKDQYFIYLPNTTVHEYNISRNSLIMSNTSRGYVEQILSVTPSGAAGTLVLTSAYVQGLLCSKLNVSEVAPLTVNYPNSTLSPNDRECSNNGGMTAYVYANSSALPPIYAASGFLLGSAGRGSPFACLVNSIRVFGDMATISCTLESDEESRKDSLTEVLGEENEKEKEDGVGRNHMDHEDKLEENEESRDRVPNGGHIQLDFLKQKDVSFESLTAQLAANVEMVQASPSLTVQKDQAYPGSCNVEFMFNAKIKSYFTVFVEYTRGPELKHTFSIYESETHV